MRLCVVIHSVSCTREVFVIFNGVHGDDGIEGRPLLLVAAITKLCEFIKQAALAMWTPCGADKDQFSRRHLSVEIRSSQHESASDMIDSVRDT